MGKRPLPQRGPGGQGEEGEQEDKGADGEMEAALRGEIHGVSLNFEGGGRRKCRPEPLENESVA